MKKIFVSLLFLLILTGCSSKTKDEEVKLVPYKEIVNNEITGLIYPHGSTVPLADNMERLIKDRTLLSTLGKNGREDALKRFLSSKNTKAIYDLYVEELGKAKSFSVSNKLFLSKGIMDMLHIKDVLMEFGRTVI